MTALLPVCPDCDQIVDPLEHETTGGTIDCLAQRLVNVGGPDLRNELRADLARLHTHALAATSAALGFDPEPYKT